MQLSDGIYYWRFWTWQKSALGLKRLKEDLSLLSLFFYLNSDFGEVNNLANDVSAREEHFQHKLMCYLDNVRAQIPDYNKGNPSKDPLMRGEDLLQRKLDNYFDSVRAPSPKTKNDQNKSKASDGRAES